MEVTQKPHLHQDWIDSHAFGIVKALQKGGHLTYLVGGCVRDLLLGIHPKDFDIATAAHPPQVKRLIYQAYIIGKRFRLVLVKRDNQQFEVATFRREMKPEEFPEGVPFGDNVFGTPEEDACRRDFTINGLFYDPVEDKLIDYIEGLKDIEARVLRMIGDPEVRLCEDPIRMLRALRLAHKIGFSLDEELRAAIKRRSADLLKSVLPRRREEILKILRLKEPDLVLLEIFDLDLMKYMMPTIHEVFSDGDKLEIFMDHFRRNHRMAPESADTVHLFGWLIYSYFQTVVESEGRESERPEDIINEERFQRFMRDDLGMYKFEQLTITKALEVLVALPQATEFRKRGERRQFAVVRNEGFALALQMAEVDYLLPPEILQFWKDLHVKFKPDLERLAEEEKGKRKTGRRRRPPRRGDRGDRGAAPRSRSGVNEEAGSDANDLDDTTAFDVETDVEAAGENDERDDEQERTVAEIGSDDDRETRLQ